MKACIERIKSMATDKKVLERKRLLETLSNDSCDLPPSPFVGKQTIDIGQNAYTDCEFFENLDKKNGRSVFDAVNTCYLRGGKQFLHSLLACPINNIHALEGRKALLESLDKKDTDWFQEVSPIEHDVLWVLQDHGEHLEDLFNTVYFRFFLTRPLNKNANVLTAYNTYRILISPLVGILSPIIYFVVPYIIIRTKFKIQIGFFSYLKLMFKTLNASEMLFSGGNNGLRYMKTVSYLFTLLFYFQGLFNSFEISRTLYRVSSHISNKMNNLAMFLKTSVSHIESLWNENMTGLLSLDESMIKPTAEESSYVNSLGFGWNYGKQLREYKMINKDIVRSILYKSYVLDALGSLVRFKNSRCYGYPAYVEGSDVPIMHLEGIRHPCLDNPIENSILLGGEKRNNAILTACNSAGKSVFIKSVLINVILCQTAAVSCCVGCKITPFDNIGSQITVPDCTGYESLFEAEMHRCKSNLDYLKGLDSKKLSLIIMDEIFNSTNPYEGISSAYCVCKKLASYTNNMLLFTTHFNYLTKLAKDTKLFTNYKMEVIKNGEDIEFTYKLKKGVNKHYLALELLKRNGFDADILDEALEIKNSFLAGSSG